MKLFLEATSERGKSLSKTANEFILLDMTVNRTPIGQVELYYYNDTKDPKLTADEWLLKYRANPDDDWNIIAQGNSEPKTVKYWIEKAFK